MFKKARPLFVGLLALFVGVSFSETGRLYLVLKLYHTLKTAQRRFDCTRSPRAHTAPGTKRVYVRKVALQAAVVHWHHCSAVTDALRQTVQCIIMVLGMSVLPLIWNEEKCLNHHPGTCLPSPLNQGPSLP